MKLRSYRLWLLVLLFLLQYLFVAWCANHPIAVEHFFSKGIYAKSLGIRLSLLQKIPFSVGDFLYALLFLWLGRLLWHSRWTIGNFKAILINLLFGINLLYFVFHFSWGLNYHRVPLAEQLGYPTTYSLKELEESLCFYLNEAHRLQHHLGFENEERVTTMLSLKELKIALYQTHVTSPPLYTKNSFFSTLLSYMGYAGYLNPFTLEAQLNNKLPKIHTVVTMAHEISHQKGYAAENEANFMGFLFCKEHPNNYIQYASALFAVRYLYSELYKADAERAKLILNTAHKGILLNIKEAHTFWQKYKNPLAPYFQKSYNQYLKANRQKKGIQSYHEVVGLIIQDHKERTRIQ